jgi:hypothetical protein
LDGVIDGGRLQRSAEKKRSRWFVVQRWSGVGNQEDALALIAAALVDLTAAPPREIIGVTRNRLRLGANISSEVSKSGRSAFAPATCASVAAFRPSSRERRDEELFETGEEPLTIDRSVEQAGASMRSLRRAERNVAVFQ